MHAVFYYGKQVLSESWHKQYLFCSRKSSQKRKKGTDKDDGTMSTVSFLPTVTSVGWNKI